MENRPLRPGPPVGPAASRSRRSSGRRSAEPTRFAPATSGSSTATSRTSPAPPPRLRPTRSQDFHRSFCAAS